MIHCLTIIGFIESKLKTISNIFNKFVLYVGHDACYRSKSYRAWFPNLDGEIILQNQNLHLNNDFGLPFVLVRKSISSSRFHGSCWVEFLKN